tara:strand:- start:1372 stop:1674 length:303 start_codon:yes stop_codon:yes gene_type:complete
MALTTTSSQSGSDKSIVKMTYSSAQVIQYTVPAGRKFKGKMWTNQAAYYGNINNIDIRTPYASSYYAHRELDIELVAGDIVRSSPTTSDHSYLVGIESDA